MQKIQGQTMIVLILGKRNSKVKGPVASLTLVRVRRNSVPASRRSAQE